MTASSNTYNVGLGSTTLAANSVTASGATVTYNINATITAGYQAAGTKWINGTKAVATGTLAAGTAAVLNNANGNVRYYRNVSTAGYLAANTTAYYLQLNTKAGGTTTVSSNTLLVNAGQFVTSALYATPAAAVYTTSNADLSCPLLTVA